MSLLVFLLLARPGGGTGGAEASPPRLRARGAAPEPTCWRRHGVTPGAEHEAKQTCCEAPGHPKTHYFDARQRSFNEPRRSGLGERSSAAARGARTPRSPTAAAAWLANTIFTFSTLMAKLHSSWYFRHGEWRARCARPRVARPASQGRGCPGEPGSVTPLRSPPMRVFIPSFGLLHPLVSLLPRQGGGVRVSGAV